MSLPRTLHRIDHSIKGDGSPHILFQCYDCDALLDAVIARYNLHDRRAAAFDAMLADAKQTETILADVLCLCEEDCWCGLQKAKNKIHALISQAEAAKATSKAISRYAR